MTDRIKYAHFDALPQLVADRVISARPHPSLPLTILNYTVKAQMTPLAEWTEPMKDCRGLILDRDGYYPDNRIVVDYGDRKEGVLLAVMAPDGVELTDLFNGQIRFHSARRFNGIKDFAIINSDPQFAGEEGFVVKWANGFMAKVKADEYCRLHRLITQCSTRTIWELLRSGAGIQELVDRVPAEFKTWVENTANELKFQQSNLEDGSRALFWSRNKTWSRKEYAEWATTHTNPGILFALLDEKPISDMCWRLVEPKWATPFKSNGEDV